MDEDRQEKRFEPLIPNCQWTCPSQTSLDKYAYQSTKYLLKTKYRSLTMHNIYTLHSKGELHKCHV